MKLEPVNKKSNITPINPYKPKVIEAEIFPPSWNEQMKELKNSNWDKEKCKKICKFQPSLWEFLEESNIIVSNLVEEIEAEVNSIKELLDLINIE